MPEIGQTVSNYRILQKIGQGGMGEVYQAKNQKLGRDVAIKVLLEEFTPSTPEFLFQTGIPVDPNLDQYAVSRDGQRLIMLVPTQEGAVSSFNVILNWFEELKERVPVE